MEAGKNLLSSPPAFLPGVYRRNSLSSSVLMLREQAAPAVSSVQTTSIACHFPTSVLLQEPREESRTSLYIIKGEDRASMGLVENGSILSEDTEGFQSDEYMKDFERQLLHWPNLWYLLPSLYARERPLLPLNVPPIPNHINKHADIKTSDVLALARKALMASKHAVSLAEESKLIGPDIDESPFPGLESSSPANLIPTHELSTVKSTRLLRMRSKKRKATMPKVEVHENSLSKTDIKKRINESFDPNNPLRLFLRAPETKQLLTLKEESELFVHIQELSRLEEVKQRLQSQFNCEPKLVEWAEAVGITCRVLQSRLHLGNRSRDKMIYANSRMVVHVAKNYQGRGLSLQDLLQEGSVGLMKSLEKFKPQSGCRFSTYAYWWIRQAIRKAIFQNSRTIRLPENVYHLLMQVNNAKKSYVQEGHHPTNEELAKRVGITAERLETLLSSTRVPLSMQKAVWSDQDTTFQEITADPGTENADLYGAKQLMRRHVRNLLSILPSKERKIIRLRYGIEDGGQKSLAETGSVLGLSKERIRQLENRALGKLKRCLSSEGLGAYADLLV